MEKPRYSKEMERALGEMEFHPLTTPLLLLTLCLIAAAICGFGKASYD